MITTPDFFGAINNINLSFDNQDDRLASLDNFDLWQIACKNGLKSSWLEWTQILGGPMCLRICNDININPLLCPGVRGNFSYQCTVNFTDVREPTVAGAPAQPAYTYDMWSVFIPEGVLTVDDQLISINIATLTEEIIAQATFCS